MSPLFRFHRSSPVWGVCAALALTAMSALAAVRAEAQEPTRVALIVANAEYDGELPDLINPLRDASAVRTALDRIGFDVEIIEDEDEAGVGDALDRFRDRLRAGGPDAVGLFYFAGHGAQWNGINYLVPSGAAFNDVTDLARSAIRMGDVYDVLSMAGNATNFLIIDACRNNPLPHPFDRTRSMERGLSRELNVPRGVKLMFSAQPGTVAFDGDGALSPFAEAFIDEIVRPNLSEEEVFRRIATRVEAVTGGRQLPWPEGVLTGSEAFYFGGRDAGAPSAPPIIIEGPGPTMPGGAEGAPDRDLGRDAPASAPPPAPLQTASLTYDPNGSGEVGNGGYTNTAQITLGDTPIGNGNRAFVSFDLAVLPPDIDVEEVTLRFKWGGMSGVFAEMRSSGSMPGGFFQRVVVDEVNIGTGLDGSDYARGGLNAGSFPTTDFRQGSITLDVTSPVRAALRRGRETVTFRLRFPEQSNNNRQGEAISIDTRGEALQLVVAYRD